MIRRSNPDLPVIFVSKPDSGDPERAERMEIIRRTYENAKNAGDHNVYFIDGETFFTGEEADVCTSDSTHPNDFGYWKMAKGMEPILREILRKIENRIQNNRIKSIKIAPEFPDTETPVH